MSDTGITQEEWPRAARAVLRVLREQCTDDLGFGQAIIAKRRLRLSTQPGSPVRVGNRDYLAARWFSRYSLAAECIGAPSAKGGYTFEALSLVLLESPLALTGFEPLLRVEWQWHPEDEVGAHAQPHWHIYHASVVRPVTRYFLVNEEASRWEPFADEVDEEEVQRGVGVPLERFHFALSASWQDTSVRVPHYLALDACDVGAWTGGCLSYIRAQLEHLEQGRASASA